MKNYDFEKAKRFIDEHKDEILNASLGMDEDWFWTAETIFEDGEYTVDLLEDGLVILGIEGSYWATPTLEVNYKDGRSVKYDCFNGESDGPNKSPFMQGVITEQITAARQGMERGRIE